METRRREGAADFSMDERLTLLGTFSLGTFHDLKTPLMTIEILAKEAVETSDPVKLRELVAALASAAVRCRRIVDGVALFVSGGMFRKRSVNLEGVVKRAVERTRDEARPDGLCVAIDVAEDACIVEADGSALELVLVNLLRNAAQAAPGRCNARVVAMRTAQGVRITCSDDGPGLDPHPPQRAGRPGKASGGFGLEIVRRLLAAHGATMRSERAAEGGACFVFDLPTECAHADDGTSAPPHGKKY